MAEAQTIVIVEGRKPVEKRLARVLTQAGYHAIPAGTKKSALARIEEAHPIVIVVDAPSLRFKWQRFCHALHEANYGVPLVVLLPEGQNPDEQPPAAEVPEAEMTESCSGLLSTLRHPISAQELTEHLSDVLAGMIQVGDLIFSVTEGSLAYHCDQRRLTPKQAHLLEILMRHPGQVLTRAFLMKHVWETDYLGDTRTLDVHVRWLRKLIEQNPSAPKYLRTIRGVGYCFEAPQD